MNSTLNYTNNIININMSEVFMKLLLNIKMYHWQTQSYAEHIATDQLYLALQPLIDSYIETMSKNQTRPQADFNIQVHTLSKDRFIQFLTEAVFKLKHISTNEPDLLNIRDEIIGQLNKTLYLFTFE
jgi:hypothetical protein